MFSRKGISQSKEVEKIMTFNLHISYEKKKERLGREVWRCDSQKTGLHTSRMAGLIERE